MTLSVTQVQLSDRRQCCSTSDVSAMCPARRRVGASAVTEHECLPGCFKHKLGLSDMTHAEGKPLAKGPSVKQQQTDPEMVAAGCGLRGGGWARDLSYLGVRLSGPCKQEGATRHPTGTTCS